jgi:hypothetical protein
MPPRTWGVNAEVAPIAEASTTRSLDEIRELEHQWSEAAMHYSPKAWPAERKAWDAMVEAKRAASLCIDPGCRTAAVGMTERCERHRVRGPA